MLQYVRFGPVVCKLQDFFNHPYWNLCQWKLDSYVIQEPEFHEDVIIEKCENEDTLLTGKEKILEEENSVFFQKRILKKEDKSTIWQMVYRKNQSLVLRFQVNAQWSHIRLLVDHTESAGQVAFEYMSNMISYTLLKKSVLTFHGVLMECEGKGIIISAPSGTGKTTHARLWRDYCNSIIINGDKASCYKKNGVWMGFGIPWSGTSGESINRNVLIKALVVLERGNENKAETLGLFSGFQKAYSNLQCPVWDREMYKLALEYLDEFLIEIPVIRLICRPDREAVEVLKKELEKIW